MCILSFSGFLLLAVLFFFFFFFFSSRRRHTRLVSDWSSDVCSSDLPRSGCAISWRISASCNRAPALRSSTSINRSEEHTSELQSLTNLVCRLLLEKKKGVSGMRGIDRARFLHRPCYNRRKEEEWHIT